MDTRACHEPTVPESTMARFIDDPFAHFAELRANLDSADTLLVAKVRLPPGREDDGGNPYERRSALRRTGRLFCGRSERRSGGFAIDRGAIVLYPLDRSLLPLAALERP